MVVRYGNGVVTVKQKKLIKFLEEEQYGKYNGSTVKDASKFITQMLALRNDDMDRDAEGVHGYTGHGQWQDN